MAKSIVDYIFRWLGLQFLGEEYRNKHLPKRNSSSPKNADTETTDSTTAAKAIAPEAVKDDAPSEPGRVGKALDKDVPRPADALIDIDSGYAPVGGGRAGGDATDASTSTIVKTSLRLAMASSPQHQAAGSERVDRQFEHFQEDAPACDVCGSLTVRNGNCYKCFNCGTSLGCS